MSQTSDRLVVARVSNSAPVADAPRRFDVFMSYNRAEGPAVERIARRLRAEGLDVFFDRWTAAGEPWQDDLAEAIHHAGACAVFIGPEGLGDWARLELAASQDRAAKDPRFRLFMVLLPGAPSPVDPRLAFLSTRTWVDLRDRDSNGFEGLIAAITGIPRHSATPSLDGGSCPYRGLEPFDEDHAGLFFGREDDVRRLCERLGETRFVAVLGPSGSGKSSLVRAGLIPALRAGAVGHSAGWTIRTMTPGGRPLAALAAQLSHVGVGDAMQDTLARVSDDEQTLDVAAAFALADGPAHDRLVLVVDQLEEAFTLCRDEEERTAFLGNLSYAATIPGGRTVVVVTLRADFYDRCAPYPELCSVLAGQHMMIGPLDADGLRRAVEEPAWAAGLTLEPGLVEKILEDVGDRPGTLPLLQHVLLQVWHGRRAGQLTLEAYVESGGVQGALAKHAEAVYEPLPEVQRTLVERIMLRLVQPGDGTEDARRRVEENELLTVADQPAAVEGLVRRLSDERLLTTSWDEASRARTVEITHEALLRGWPRLRRWIERDREALFAHRRLTEASREWERSGRDEALLYRGTRLAAWRPSDQSAGFRRRRLTEAVEWRARRYQNLNQLEREFLAASDARAQRDRTARRRRIRLACAGLAIALAAITVVAAVAVHRGREAQRQRDIAVSGALTAQSAANLRQGNVDVAALLGLEAYRAWPTIDARNAVLSVLPSLERSAGVLRGHTDDLNTVAFSEDGKLVATAGDDRSVQVWTTATHRPRGLPFRAHTEAVNTVAFSPDGAVLASGGWDKDVLLSDVDSHRLIGRLRGHKSGVFGVAFSSDGTTLLSAGADGTIRRWDLTTRHPKGVPLNDHLGPIYGLALSPDGKTIAAGGAKGFIRLWRMNGQSLGRLPTRRSSEINALAFGRDGATLASADAGGRVQLWDVEHRHARGGPVMDGTANVVAVQFSHDGTTLAFAGEDHAVHLWDVPRHRRLAGPLKLHTGVVNGLAFDPSDQTLASVSADTMARFWQIRPQHALAATLQGHVGRIYGLAVAPNGKTLAASGADDTVELWNMRGRRSAVRIPTGHSGGVLSVAFSPDGGMLATAGDKTVRLWDVATRRRLAVLPGDAGDVWDVEFVNGGRRVAAASTDGIVRLWDVATHQRLPDLTGHRGRISDLAISPDGMKLAAGGMDDNTVRVWDLRRPVPGAVLHGTTGGVTGVAFAKDGKTLAATDGRGSVLLWSVANLHSPGMPLARGGGAILQSLGFSPDGKTVAAVDLKGSLHLWDVATRRALGARLKAHRGVGYRVAFEPGGRSLATAGEDGDVKLWNQAIWSDDRRALGHRICGEVGYSLTRAEWTSLLPGEPYHQTCK